MPIRITPGSQIVANGTRSNRSYADRNIDNLKAVGAIDDAQRDLFSRADGIIDAQPSNGRIEFEELQRLEQPSYNNALFPEERVALPQLWRFLEWSPASAPAAAPSFSGPVSASVSVSLPTDPDLNKPFNIDRLPSALQRTARRTQLVEDRDQSATTLSLADIAAVIASPGRFTARDLRELAEIKNIVTRALVAENDTTQMQATTRVPALGAKRFPIVGTSDILGAVVDTQLIEDRTIEHVPYVGNHLRISVGLKRESSFDVSLSDSQKMILLDLDSGNEIVAKRSGYVSIPQGRYRYELWENGQRQQSQNVEIPALPKNEMLHLKDSVNHVFVDDNGNALSRTPVEELNQGVRFSYAPSAQAIEARYLRNVESMDHGLTPGSYQLALEDIGPVKLHAFESGAMKVEALGEEVWLKPGLMKEGTFEGYHLHPTTKIRKEFSFSSETGALEVKEIDQTHFTWKVTKAKATITEAQRLK